MWRKCLIFAGLVVLTGSAAGEAKEKRREFSYDDYAAVLKNYVDDAGMVNYKKLKAKPEKLNAFVTTLNSLDPNSFSRWNEKEQIALWLNAYNAFTLKAIIDNYPIKSSFVKSLRYPANSIRQIPGVWDKITFTVSGKSYTLGHIEHKILRKEFNEPRIHMALVCAAIGCPALRNEPYTGSKLDWQLDSQGRKFFTDPMKSQFDPEERVLKISPILKWFAGDFVKTGSAKKTKRYSKKQARVLEFVSKYLDKDFAFFSTSAKAVKIKYLKYDWSLNEQAQTEDKK